MSSHPPPVLPCFPSLNPGRGGTRPAWPKVQTIRLRTRRFRGRRATSARASAQMSARRATADRGSRAPPAPPRLTRSRATTAADPTTPCPPPARDPLQARSRPSDAGTAARARAETSKSSSEAVARRMAANKRRAATARRSAAASTAASTASGGAATALGKPVIPDQAPPKLRPPAPRSTGSADGMRCPSDAGTSLEDSRDGGSAAAPTGPQRTQDLISKTAAKTANSKKPAPRDAGKAATDSPGSASNIQEETTGAAHPEAAATAAQTPRRSARRATAPQRFCPSAPCMADSAPAGHSARPDIDPQIVANGHPARNPADTTGESNAEVEEIQPAITEAREAEVGEIPKEDPAPPPLLPVAPGTKCSSPAPAPQDAVQETGQQATATPQARLAGTRRPRSPRLSPFKIRFGRIRAVLPCPKCNAVGTLALDGSESTASGGRRGSRCTACNKRTTGERLHEAVDAAIEAHQIPVSGLPSSAKRRRRILATRAMVARMAPGEAGGTDTDDDVVVQEPHDLLTALPGDTVPASTAAALSQRMDALESAIEKAEVFNEDRFAHVANVLRVVTKNADESLDDRNNLRTAVGRMYRALGGLIDHIGTGMRTKNMEHVRHQLQHGADPKPAEPHRPHPLPRPTQAPDGPRRSYAAALCAEQRPIDNDQESGLEPTPTGSHSNSNTGIVEPSEQRPHTHPRQHDPLPQATHMVQDKSMGEEAPPPSQEEDAQLAALRARLSASGFCAPTRASARRRTHGATGALPAHNDTRLEPIAVYIGGVARGPVGEVRRSLLSYTALPRTALLGIDFVDDRTAEIIADRTAADQLTRTLRDVRLNLRHLKNFDPCRGVGAAQSVADAKGQPSPATVFTARRWVRCLETSRGRAAQSWYRSSLLNLAAKFPTLPEAVNGMPLPLRPALQEVDKVGRAATNEPQPPIPRASDLGEQVDEQGDIQPAALHSTQSRQKRRRNGNRPRNRQRDNSPPPAAPRQTGERGIGITPAWMQAAQDEENGTRTHPQTNSQDTAAANRAAHPSERPGPGTEDRTPAAADTAGSQLQGPAARASRPSTPRSAPKDEETRKLKANATTPRPSRSLHERAASARVTDSAGALGDRPDVVGNDNASVASGEHESPDSNENGPYSDPALPHDAARERDANGAAHTATEVESSLPVKDGAEEKSDKAASEPPLPPQAQTATRDKDTASELGTSPQPARAQPQPPARPSPKN